MDFSWIQLYSINEIELLAVSGIVLCWVELLSENYIQFLAVIEMKFLAVN